MNFSLHDLKESLYILETLFGVILLVLAYLSLKLAWTGPDGLFYVVPGLVLFCMGIACLLFGIESVILRDDPDIWD
ncbi:MAG: hypothetical protein C5B53_06485 [Candidatus Melainabacteria bacterium]|nr:MAG: hypothetical protein C5B53_06485 [Candidatus Melainabacteria bacterium]